MKTITLQRFLAVSCVCFVVYVHGVARAQRSVVARVLVEGNRDVAADKILRVLDLKRGEPFEATRVRDGLKRLYATKQFDDIQAWLQALAGSDSVDVIVRVSEYPRVDDVRLVNNKHVSNEDINKILSIGKGTFVRPALVGRDRDKILAMYRDKGYYRATMHDTIVTDDAGQRVLEYRFDEGDKVSVKHVDFVGVTGLDTRQVRSVMKMKEDRWWRGADFKPKELDADRQRIIHLYKSHGYLDARILGVDLNFSDDGRALDLFVKIDEGMRYYVGKITWSGNVLLPDTAIASMIALHRGDPFDEPLLSHVQGEIGNRYWNQGYIYSTVSPVKKVRGDTVDVDLQITQGDLARVHEINIVGNTKTVEQVIRRELILAPGDVFAANRLRRSLRDVFSLGFFAGPPEPSFSPSDSGGIDLTLKVAEKPSGQFRLGAGFSQLNRVSGFVGVTEPNFLGRGVRVGVDWEFSKFRQNINLQFTEPWLFGSRTSVSGSVFSTNQNQVRQQFYSDTRTGFSLRMGRPIPWLDYSTGYLNYRLESVKLSDFSAAYTGPLRNVDWPQTTSSFELSLLRNSTDNPFHPSRGTRTRVSGRWSGGVFGGDVTFQRYQADVSWYNRLFWKAVLQFRANVAVLDGYGNQHNVPDYELFRLGGNRTYGLRGYDFFEVVPEGNAQFIGGRFMSIYSYEISFPIAPPTVYGLGFFDAGNTWNSFRSADMLNLRRGAGLGMRIELPMLGTVGIDYGYGFDRVGGGRWEPHISFGSGF